MESFYHIELIKQSIEYRINIIIGYRINHIEELMIVIYYAYNIIFIKT